MRFAQAFGLGILLCSVTLVLAGGGIGIPKKEDVPKYLDELKTSKAADVRAKAAEMLGRRGAINVNDVQDAIEPLKNAVQKDKEGKVRAAAIRALGNINPEADGIVPILLDKLKNDDVQDVKIAAVVALGQYGADARDALPTLRQMMAKFDTKAAKNSAESKTIQAAIQQISGAKKKKN